MLAVSRAFSKKELEFYIEWLEYIPKHWELNRILEKKVKNLTPLELDKLVSVNNDKNEALFIKGFIERFNSKGINKSGKLLANISIEENEKLSNIIRRFRTEEIFKSKLSDEELEMINECTLEELHNSDIDNPLIMSYAEIIVKRNNENVESDNIKKLQKSIV